MSERDALERLFPEIADDGRLADVVEQAFDYRGDVTIATRDGASRVGYVFNRRRDVPVPFIQMFPAGGGPAETIPYADIRRIAFTGRDTAAGNSYAAWLKRRQVAPVPGDPSGATAPPEA